MSKRLIMTKGLPGSGKTTWALNQIKLNPDIKRINKDSLRDMFHGGKWTHERENFIVSSRNVLVHNALLQNYSVIVDDTNLAPKHEVDLKQIADIHSAEFIVQSFTHIFLKECIKNDLKRANSVGEAVIRRMYEQFLKPKDEVYQDKEGNPWAIIIDIDGTVAKHNNLRGHYESDKVHLDQPNQPIIQIIKRFSEDYSRIFVTGRDDGCREQTKEWLKKYGLCGDYINLFMRKLGDHRSDEIVKSEIFERDIRPCWNINCVFDDRDRVVEMWRQKGLTCLQVDRGNF